MEIEQKRQFLFRCKDCEMILAVDFETKEDLEKVDDDKITLECFCGGISKIIRN